MSRYQESRWKKGRGFPTLAVPSVLYSRFDLHWSFVLQGKGNGLDGAGGSQYLSGYSSAI